MKRKALALGLALVLSMPLSMTALAASSSASNNSGNQTQETQQPAKETPKSVDEVVKSTPAGGAVKAENVTLAVAGADGTAKATTLNAVVGDKQTEVKAVVAAVAARPGADSVQVAATVNNMLTGTASPQFTATVVALAETKGGSMVVNNMGSVKTAAVAKDALGNTIASAGVVEHVTSGSLIMLMSVNVDGSIEYVEGVVDPVTGAVMGAFKGTPSIITVLVLA